MDDIKFLWISTKSYDNFSSVESHYHNFYQLQFIISGKEQFNIRNQSFELNENTLIFIPEFVQHSYSFKERSQILDIKFEICGNLKRILEPLNHKQFIHLYKNIDLIYIKHLIQLFEVYNEVENDELTLFQLETQFKMILLNLLKNQRDITQNIPIEDNNIGIEIYEYIKTNYMNNITLSSLSKEFYFSPKYITQLIKRTFNVTPNKLIQKVRVEKGAYFLLNTEHSINYIANLVGLSQNRFNDIFKKNKKVTPLVYRKIKYKNIENLILSEDFDIRMEP